MVSNDQLSDCREKVREYIKRYYSKNPVYQQHIVAREEHLYRVALEIRDIGVSLELNKNELNLAEVIALLHDIGRFEQYRVYRTFVDVLSEDHAILSVKVIADEKLIGDFSIEDQEIIVSAVRHHNMALLPETLVGDKLFYARLLRDADKIDLFRIVTRKFSEQISKDAEQVFPDLPDVSDEVYKDLMAERLVNIANIRTLNGFKFLQLGWLYNINFYRTFEIIRERKYLEKIRKTFNTNPRTEELFKKLHAFLDIKLETH